MGQFDFKKFVENLDDHELVLIIAEEYKPSQVIALILAKKTDYRTIYRKIIGKHPPLENSTLRSELNKKLTDLSLQDLLQLLCEMKSRRSLKNELNKLNKKTQTRIMYNKIDKSILEILKNIAVLTERIYDFPNEFNGINELGEMIELIELTIESEGETDELKQSKIELTKKVEKSVTTAINEYYRDRFQISDNGINYRNEIPKINIHNVHAHTVVFDFYADRKENFVKFKDEELNEGSHFFMIWLNNIVGLPESERFIYLNGKLEEDIITVDPFMNKLYIIELYDRNDNQLLGVINNEGDLIAKPMYSEFIKLSENYFKGYRVNPDKNTNELGDQIDEKWVLLNEAGQITEFNCKNLISVDEKNKVVVILNNDNNEIEYSLTGKYIGVKY